MVNRGAHVLGADSLFRYATVQFFDAQQGVRSGYTNSEWNAAFVIQFTDDGGQTWKIPPGLDATLGDSFATVGPAINFLNKDFGMSVSIDGSMKRYEREIGPNSFSSTILAGYTTWHWTDIHCSNAMNCVAVGYKNEFGNGGYQPVIERTTDGGKTWRELQHNLRSGRSAPPGTPVAHSVYCFDNTSAIIVGDSGIYLHTTDNDMVEQIQLDLDLAKPWHFDRLSFFDDQYGMMKSGGDVILTEDSGQTWENKNISMLYGLSIPWIIDRNTLFVVSPFDYHHSTDFGKSWSQDDYRDDISGSVAFSDITFTDTQTGWFIASHQVNNQGQRVNTVLLKSTDAGATWKTIIDEELQGAEFGIEHIDFASPQHGMMMGKGDIAYVTVNFGDTWDPIELPLKHSAFESTGFITSGFSYPSREHAFAVSNGGEMLRYNGGVSSVEDKDATSLEPVWLWTIVPNPAKDRVSMTVSWFPKVKRDAITLKVYDLTGREIQDLTPALRAATTANNRAKVGFDTQDLSEGTYIVSASGQGYVKSRLLQIVR